MSDVVAWLYMFNSPTKRLILFLGVCGLVSFALGVFAGRSASSRKVETPTRYASVDDTQPCKASTVDARTGGVRSVENPMTDLPKLRSPDGGPPPAALFAGAKPQSILGSSSVIEAPDRALGSVAAGDEAFNLMQPTDLPAKIPTVPVFETPPVASRPILRMQITSDGAVYGIFSTAPAEVRQQRVTGAVDGYYYKLSTDAGEVVIDGTIARPATVNATGDAVGFSQTPVLFDIPNTNGHLQVFSTTTGDDLLTIEKQKRPICDVMLQPGR